MIDALEYYELLDESARWMYKNTLAVGYCFGMCPWAFSPRKIGRSLLVELPSWIISICLMGVYFGYVRPKRMEGELKRLLGCF